MRGSLGKAKANTRLSFSKSSHLDLAKFSKKLVKFNNRICIDQIVLTFLSLPFLPKKTNLKMTNLKMTKQGKGHWASQRPKANTLLLFSKSSHLDLAKLKKNGQIQLSY